MDPNKLLRMAGVLLSSYKPSKKSQSSKFITKKQIVAIILEKYEKAPICKVLKFAQFKSSVINKDGKSQRGYWVEHADTVPDVLKLLDIDKPAHVVQHLFLNNEADVLKHITDNWYSLRQYMTDDIVQEYNRDPTFRTLTTFKINKAIKLAGFTNTFTLFEENRVLAKPEIKKSQKKKPVRNMEKLLHKEFYE